MGVQWYYIIGINFVLFVPMGVDKQKAIHGKYRISEKTLWFFAIIGGAIGGTAGMYAFRHKTKHSSFKYGLPLLAILQIWLLVKLSS